MKNFNLQMFAEAVSGKKIVYLFRPLNLAATLNAAILAFTTENSRTKSRDAESTETKDGPIRTPGAMEQEITATSILAKGDILIEQLESAMDRGQIIEIWEANLDDNIENNATQFKGVYYQGYLTEFEITSTAEDFVECSLTFAINGKGVSGNVTVSIEQQTIAEYVFADTNATGKTGA